MFRKEIIDGVEVANVLYKSYWYNQHKHVNEIESSNHSGVH